MKAISPYKKNSWKKNSVLQTRQHKGGNNSRAQTFYPSLSKPIVDKIDTVLARYFNFTDEEWEAERAASARL